MQADHGLIVAILFYQKHVGNQRRLKINVARTLSNEIVRTKQLFLLNKIQGFDINIDIKK